MVKDLIRINRALISVSDKTNVDFLAKKLEKHNIEIISTGGTAKFLKQNCDKRNCGLAEWC